MLDLAWLPDERVRCRRAIETSLYDSCLRCEPGTTTDPIGNVRVLPVVPVQPRGRPVDTGADLSQAVTGGEAWIEITSRTQPVVVDEGVPDTLRVDVAYLARARVSGRGPVVTSWGVSTVSAGGRVAAASGSRTELDGGSAAVSDGGVLIARCGRAVVDAGGQVVLAQDAHDPEVAGSNPVPATSTVRWKVPRPRQRPGDLFVPAGGMAVQHGGSAWAWCFRPACRGFLAASSFPVSRAWV